MERPTHNKIPLLRQARAPNLDIIRQYVYGVDAHRIAPQHMVLDPYCLYNAWRLLLHRILEEVDEGGEQFRIEDRPYAFEEGVYPFCGFAGAFRVLLKIEDRA